jgi:hypothetical protein
MWGGSRYFTNRAIEFIDSVRSPNPRITSRKRLTAFGNPGSDHWVANRQADAVDFGLVSDHEAKNELAQRFHFPGHGAVPDFATWTTKHDGHTYRHQVIAGTHGTGPHLHYGCRRVG